MAGTSVGAREGRPGTGAFTLTEPADVRFTVTARATGSMSPSNVVTGTLTVSRANGAKVLALRAVGRGKAGRAERTIRLQPGAYTLSLGVTRNWGGTGDPSASAGIEWPDPTADELLRPAAEPAPAPAPAPAMAVTAAAPPAGMVQTQSPAFLLLVLLLAVVALWWLGRRDPA